MRREPCESLRVTTGISRRDAVRVLGAGLFAGPLARLASAFPLSQGRPPNLLVFMTDDQRQDTMGVYGNTILRTPHMDRIATEGVRFTESFVTNSLCAPSRASLLTGLYSHAHGVVSNGGGPLYYNQPGLREAEITYPEALQQAGYHTGLVGKWHLRSQPTGFAYSVYFGRPSYYRDPEMIANGASVTMRGHADDVVGDQALAFLRRRPVDRPFCLLCHFISPHRAWIPAERFAHAFDDVEIPVPRTFEDRLAGRPEALRRAEMAVADMPDFRNRGVSPDLPPAERKRLNLQHLVKNYYRTLLSVDENVGRVLQALDEATLADNTVVIYTSDNGFFLGEHGLFDKRLMYEPSIRVPLLVRYPARIPPRVDSTNMVLNVDLMPTILELAGVPVPAAVHGRSLTPLLAGRSVPWRDDFLYEYYEYPAEHCARKNRGIRTHRWKLIHFWEQPEEWELYDLQTDPDEMNNLAYRAEHASRRRSLELRMNQLRAELGDVDPPGPPPVALPCGNGVNTGYGPPEG
jgi:arylsulfatase A-like enzyme